MTTLQSRSARWLHLLPLAVAFPAAAQVILGSVSGTVFDSSGQPVAEAIVSISGAPLPGGRRATTDENGLYRIPLLPPGEYVIEVSKQGLGSNRQNAVVEVDRDTQVDFVVGITVQEAVTVTAVMPRIDLRSAELDFNFKRDVIDNLPLQRNYSGLFQLIPGVPDNNITLGAGGAPSAGGSKQDNTYLLDGVNITNPGFGYLSTEVNEFDIAEFSVKRGAVSAEFGRSSGVVTNAVTRSGTNTVAAGFRFTALPADWVADPKGRIRDTTDRWQPSFGVGGPLIRDRIFFYGSGLFLRTAASERANNWSRATGGQLPDKEERINELFGKITGQPTPAHSINAGYRHRPRKVDFDSIGVNDSPETASHFEGTNRVATVMWTWFPTGRTAVDVRYLRLDEENESVAVTDLGFQPAFDPRNPASVGLFTEPTRRLNLGGAEPKLNRQNFSRDEVKTTATFLFDLARSSHQLKGGFGWEATTEDLLRKSNGWGIISLVQTGTQFSALYWPEQNPQLSKSRTYSLFIQDDISIGQRLAINAGLLVNRDEFAQEIDRRNTFLTFDFSEELQPRVGVNYNLRRGAGDKVYAHYGRYYSMDQKSTARSLASLRLFQSEAFFDLNGNLISDRPSPNTTGKVIDQAMNPTYMDEFVVGYATPLGGPWSLDAFFLFRDSDNFIEDFPTILPFTRFLYSNLPAAERRYRALTFELERRLRDRWSLIASYSWSKFYGNFDLDYRADLALFNTSSLLEDGPGAFVEDRFRQGVLSQDRPHVFKLFATYLPIEEVTIGGYLRSQSGTPWEARGLPWPSLATFLRYLEPAGTNRTGSWTNLDLLVGYRLPLNGRPRVTVQGHVLNVFDAQTGLSVDQRRFLDGRIRAFTTQPGPNCDRACYTELMVQGTTRPNPEYGLPTSFAPPRRVLVTAAVEF